MTSATDPADGGYDFLGSLPRHHDKFFHACSDAALDASAAGQPRYVHVEGPYEARAYVVTDTPPHQAHFAVNVDASKEQHWVRRMNGVTTELGARPRPQDFSYLIDETAEANA